MDKTDEEQQQYQETVLEHIGYLLRAKENGEVPSAETEDIEYQILWDKLSLPLNGTNDNDSSSIQDKKMLLQASDVTNIFIPMLMTFLSETEKEGPATAASKCISVATQNMAPNAPLSSKVRLFIMFYKELYY